ncbi:MAG: GDP-mannose 4,6-dehydratase, partial [Bacteroidia bacterium]|nr:GDP-mannose 4,6-dehydratase [Bacteroidia bacterium]
AVSELISNNHPDYIFHLAANSTTNHDALFENHSTISTGTLTILEAVKKNSPKSKVFISGSGLQFKNSDKPIKETDEFEARDAYSVSRIHSVFAARYFRTMGIKAYVGYFFNHDSPLRTERHITKKISESAMRIAAGSSEKLQIGDISVIKEYAFAGDIVKGIWTLVSQDAVMEANIASGKGYSIEDWLQQCFSLVKRNWRDYVEIKKDFVAEYKYLVSDPAVIFSLGWKPEISLEQLSKMMMS